MNEMETKKKQKTKNNKKHTAQMADLVRVTR
jgi:hypothetical protein